MTDQRKPSLPSTRALSNRILAVIDRVMDEDEDWCRDNVADAIAVELDAAIPVARAEDELLATQVEAWACQRDAEHKSEPHDDMKQARTAALHRAASRLRALAAAGIEPTCDPPAEREPLELADPERALIGVALMHLSQSPNLPSEMRLPLDALLPKFTRVATAVAKEPS